MGAASNDGRGHWVLSVLAGALLCGGVACATSGGGGAAGSDAAVLSDVHVEERGDATVVQLRGVGNPLYTVVPEADGSRLVMTLDRTRAEGLPDGIAPVAGLVDEVEIASQVRASGEPYTRVALHVDGPVEHEVLEEGEGLAVRVWPGTQAASAKSTESAGASGASLAAMEPEEAFGAAEADSAEATQPAEAGGSPEEPAPTPVTAPQATALVGVEATPDAVRLLADGRMPEVETFALEDPARLVIDLPGIENRRLPGRIPVEGERVARVRVGQHADKLRVVIDGASAGDSMAAWEVVPLDDGLRVEPRSAAEAEIAAGPETGSDEATSADPARRGDAEASRTEPEKTVETAESAETEELQTAAAPAQDAAEDAADQGGSPAEIQSDPRVGARDAGEAAATITGVDLRAGTGSRQVVISTQGEASYQLYEPDGETVVVSLPDAALAPEADSRIAPEPGGPISLVMAFEQPGGERPEVRVVISRASGAKPAVVREGGDVVVSFPEETGVARIPPALDESRAAGEEAQTSTAPAKSLAQAKQPGPASPPAAPSPEAQGIEVLEEGGLLEGKEYVGRRISLDFKDVEIDDVLRLIAEVSDLNIIAGDNVSGNVTIRLVDVPWDQALDVILMTKGLGFRKVGNVLRIAPQNLLQQEEEARLQERRAKEKLEDLIVKFQPVNYASVNEVARMVQRLLSARGTVDTDPRTNTVILKDIPSVVDESVALIKAIDTPTPQVLIEAKIVEANLDFSRELGMVWGFGIQELNDGFDSGSGIDDSRGGEDFRFRPDAGLISPSGPTGDLNNFVIQNPISQASDANALVNLGAFLLDEKFNLEAQLQAAEATGEGKVVSSPRVVTLDNREAEIQQGVAIPFQTFENGDAQLQFVDAVLELKVKPHITADRSIIMELEVSRNAPDDSVATNTGTPGISKNETQTETLVRDGQTLVIGGIYTIQKSDRENRVPYLHSVPGLGNLFKSRSVRDIRQELLIFVTPRIVQMPELGS